MEIHKRAALTYAENHIKILHIGLEFEAQGRADSFNKKLCQHFLLSLCSQSRDLFCILVLVIFSGNLFSGSDGTEWIASATSWYVKQLVKQMID